MSKLVPLNNPVLHATAENVPTEEIRSDHIQKIIKDLKLTLREYSDKGFVGIAIAAPQIGIPLRIFITEDVTARKDGEGPIIPSVVAINPQIIKYSSKHTLAEEGCLSVPDHFGIVRRAKNITLRAFDENGKEFTRGAGGLLSIVFQHECDHLDGILFTDRAERIIPKSELENKRNTDAPAV